MIVLLKPNKQGLLDIFHQHLMVLKHLVKEKKLKQSKVSKLESERAIYSYPLSLMIGDISLWNNKATTCVFVI